MNSLSHVRLFATLWTIAHQAPPSMEFPRQEYWSGLPFPSLGDLPDPGIKPRSPALKADTLPSEPPGKPHGCESWTIKKTEQLTKMVETLTLNTIFNCGGLDGKDSACSAGDLGLIPGSGRSSGEGNGNPLQYSCLENPMDQGA